MAGLEPSTLYARRGGPCPAGAGQFGLGCTGQASAVDAQFSIYAILCHYRRPAIGQEWPEDSPRGIIGLGAPSFRALGERVGDHEPPRSFSHALRLRNSGSPGRWRTLSSSDYRPPSNVGAPSFAFFWRRVGDHEPRRSVSHALRLRNSGSPAGCPILSRTWRKGGRPRTSPFRLPCSSSQEFRAGGAS
jgi:hypothetical protein